MVNPAPILCCLWFRLDVNLKVKTLKVEKKWNKNYFKGLILTLICVFCDWSLAGLAKPHGCFSCGFFLLCSTQLSTEQLSLWDSLIAWSTTGPKHTHIHTDTRARLRFADLNRSRLPLNCPPRHNHTSLDPYTRPQRVKDLGKTLKALKCWHAHINTQTHTHRQHNYSVRSLSVFAAVQATAGRRAARPSQEAGGWCASASDPLMTESLTCAGRQANMTPPSEWEKAGQRGRGGRGSRL